MLEFVSMLFNAAWELLSIPWPGFSFPIGYAFLGVAFAAIALRLVGQLFDHSIGFGSISISSGNEVHGGNNKSLAIVPERRNDII